MFDVDTFVTDCIAAHGEPEPRHAIKAVLERAVRNGSEVAAALPPERAEIQRLHVTDELTVIKVVWAPGMSLYPHDHRMWAAIGIYTGGEDNTFYRRAPARRLTQSGAKELRPGDVTLLGDDTIHAVRNPTSQFAGAIHVYDGNFFTRPRSEWDPDTLEERPYDVAATLQHFEDENRRVAD